MQTILHVIDTTGPGGAEIVFVELADRLRARGYKSIPVIRGPGWVYDELTRRALAPVVVDAKGSFNLMYLRELVRLIRKERVSLIQSHLLGSNVYCALAGWITGTPVVGTFHGMVDISPSERFRAAKLWIMERGIQRFVAVSQNLADSVGEKKLLNPQRTSIVYNGVDIARYSRPPANQLRARVGVGPEAVLAVCVGNIRPAKAYDVLIRAAALLLPRHPHLHFVIAGHIKTELMEQLNSLMSALHVSDRFHFIGFVKDTAAFLSDADLFVLSSRNEGFSISAVEALASGLPSVMTRCGGPQEIATHEVNALMVAAEDAAELANGIERLLDDPVMAARLGDAGREMVKSRFHIDSMVGNYAKLYQSIWTSQRPFKTTD